MNELERRKKAFERQQKKAAALIAAGLVGRHEAAKAKQDRITKKRQFRAKDQGKCRSLNGTVKTERSERWCGK
jgi:hypothetical protein